MPELPDVTVYVEALEARLRGHGLKAIRLASPFLLRSVEPKVADVVGREVLGVRRIAKRIAIELTDAHFVVIHLMVAGRFKWDDKPGAKIPGRIGLAGFDFDSGTLILTEASSRVASTALPTACRGVTPKTFRDPTHDAAQVEHATTTRGSDTSGSMGT